MSTPSRLHGALLLVLALACAACPGSLRSDFGASTLPAQLTDSDFWRLSESLSEPPGSFTHSDNLVSNEVQYVHVIRLLNHRGGVYVGVGPEQNFSYIARLRPEMAFVVDIRQENRNLHLMYKALFELSADRAEFLSRLFSRARPPGVGATTSVAALFDGYATMRPAAQVHDENARLIRERLLDVHHFPLSPDDLKGIEYAFDAFYTDGPDIQYSRSRPDDSPGPSYHVLMTAADARGLTQSYLSSEDGFAFVKDLHARNMIVPVVGDFGGPRALRAIATYIREHEGVVNAFYGSNVEVYLNREKMRAFCASLATLPYDARTRFIGNKGMQSFSSKLKACPAQGR